MALSPARAATEADAVALARFLRRCSAAYLDEERGTPEEVDERLHEPGSDMALDTALVEADDGEIEGFAHLFTEPPHEDVRCWARVDPAHSGRGIGSALVRWALERGAALAERRPDGTPAVLHATQWARDTAATRLYEVFGFLPVRYFMRMWADLTQEIPQPSFPGDLAVRACAADDEERLLEAHREAFAAHWGATFPELGRWKQERTDAGRYDSDLWRLAVDGGQIVGFVLARPQLLTDATTGYVDDLGVVPSWRGRGLGLALLLDVFAVLKDRGLVRAALNVDAENATGAVDLYRRAGMTAEPNLIIWERPLR